VATEYNYNIYIQVLNKPSSEQECSKVHEPYALHKKIRSKECPFSKEIFVMEERFKRFKLKFNWQILAVVQIYSYVKENKLPSPLERMEFNKTITNAEEMVIREGDFQIGKLHNVTH